MNLKKILKNKDFILIIGTIFGSLLYCFGVVFVLDLGLFYSSGITGTSQLIVNFIAKITGKQIIGLKSIIIALFNIPLFLIAFKGVSKRFAILSLISVVLQTLAIAVFEIMFDKGFNPFKCFANDDIGSKLCLSIVGGLITGFANGISLKAGSSTGGVDVISQYLSLKKHISFAKISTTIDMCIIFFATLVGSIEIACFTVIRLIIAIIVLDKIHTIYKYEKVSIVTEEKQRMRDALVKSFNHGVTIYQVYGGYTNKPKYCLETVCFSFESSEYVRTAKEIDPKCFINTTHVKKVDGAFRINVIA